MKVVGRMAETQFKQGHVPHNTKPIGFERVAKDGYIEVKVREKPENGKKNFEFKHRLIWEHAHGEIPKGHLVIFLDGDKRNFDLDNLALISQAENLEMYRKGLRTSNNELTETGVLIARSIITSRKRRKQNGRT